jgi:pilus assembly protein CpaE
VVAIRDLPLHQEVLDFVVRDGRIDVVDTTTDKPQLELALRRGSVDAVICCAELASTIDDAARSPSGSSDRPARLYVVAHELTVPVLRKAIELGAVGAFRWPEERQALGDQLHRRRLSASRPGGNPGTVVAVHGARGGAGTTFVACQLAAALSARGISTVLVDAALALPDVTAALGVSSGREVRTISDLVPVVDEVSMEHLEKVLYRHPAGFAALLGPFDASTVGATPGALVRAAISSLRAFHGAVVVHTPRCLDDAALEALQLADAVLLVTSLDLFSLYGAKRVIHRVGSVRSGALHVVVNKAVRSSVGVGDLERVLGVAPVARVRFDAAVPRAQQRGELLPPRSGRAARDVEHVADWLANSTAAPGKVS